ARRAALALAGLAVLQAMLGVSTLVAGSPVFTSLAHQAGAVLLWIGTIGVARLAWRQHNTAIVNA
ncbi:MAG TPA: hypothetical protein DHW63_08200, partial [Hyphomonadaceae bacterium]|nr:hypothetical protein [Hyphomonadaceae bacterium]